jgi:GMP synthase (glutamine-hydrolysing)
MFSDVIVFDKENITKDFDVRNYDLLVLSGGSNVPTVLRHREEYSFEIDLVKKSNIPILGICLGAEIITEAFNGKLEQLSEEHRGIVELQIIDIDLQKVIREESIKVNEGHHIGIKTLPKEFISCAKSKHGIEILKHNYKSIIGFQFNPEISDNKKLFDWVFEVFKDID